MKIETGKGKITLLTLLSIWAISLTVNLPGLAIIPLLGSLDSVFADTSEIEIQLLTIVPNLIIIPFVLLSGKLAESGHKVRIVVIALLIYLGSGLMYLFAQTMVELIVISTLLGVGCGLLIPLAAGLLADAFTGRYRLQQLGIKSSIANLSLVVATYAVGWLEGENWHLPFLVYLIPIIPLALSPMLLKLKAIEKPKTTFPTTTLAETASKISTSKTSSQATTHERVVGGFIVKRLLGVMSFYFIICFAATVLIYYLPFAMHADNIDDTSQGTITALFFLAIFIPGLILRPLIKALKQHIVVLALLLMVVGIAILGASTNAIVLAMAAFITGWGYGILQPIIYDKTVQTVVSDHKATLALSFVLAINYLSITIAPLIIDGVSSLANQEANGQFPFYFNATITLLFALVALIWRGDFTFKIDDEYIAS